MTDHPHHHGEQDRETGGMPSASKWAMVAFLAIAGYFLIMEHRAHVIQFSTASRVPASTSNARRPRWPCGAWRRVGFKG